ncbi:hypothetical protein BGW36DRAFT_94050 [Talaromyces proteolyticus]|uniref:Transcription factor domain-containing protein n=1 Tax=Talaromyces proteolyticus TaxID=1131652 RepID=A0AAD4Q557_9EURO|nr:uncharacterized protein BGW36DRAFT_94050 [Talaromyces proteolyticus]KAH8703941.1 hypothetical protein BGW36DRAFT_94050 [Talaromyces proteolyticus]
MSTGLTNLLLEKYIRETGMAHQHIYGYYYSAWRQELDSGMSLGPVELQEAWRSFVDEESLKLGLYGVSVIDFQLVLACNTRPEISPLEIVWDLPWSTQSWEANTAEEWWKQIVEEASTYQGMDGRMSDRGLIVKSVFLVTQSLLSDAPPEPLLRSLSSSPFALFCVTANIYRLVRGFTHYLYQLPPNPANPSPFHMLTHVQNSQISSALNVILGLRSADQNVLNTYGQGDGLWDAVELVCWVTKVSLCIPDDLLISGIVDTEITAAFATAVHLSLGNQVLGRRSRNIFKKSSTFSDHGFLLIFEELMNVMNAMWGADAQKAMREAPWISVLGFRVLLDLYRVLRLAITDIHERAVLGTFSSAKSFDPAHVIYSAVKDALAIHLKNKRTLLATRNLEQLGLLELTEDPKVFERKFIILMIQSCNERNVWAVGRAMAMVLEVISTGDQS